MEKETTTYQKDILKWLCTIEYAVYLKMLFFYRYKISTFLDELIWRVKNEDITPNKYTNSHSFVRIARHQYSIRTSAQQLKLVCMKYLHYIHEFYIKFRRLSTYNNLQMLEYEKA